MVKDGERGDPVETTITNHVLALSPVCFQISSQP